MGDDVLEQLAIRELLENRRSGVTSAAGSVSARCGMPEGA